MAFTNEEFNDFVDKIKKYEMLKKNYEEKISWLKNRLKEDMHEQNVDEVKTDRYIIRNKSVTSNRFDTTRFKKEHKDLYEAYIVTSTNERFTIN